MAVPAHAARYRTTRARAVTPVRTAITYSRDRVVESVVEKKFVIMICTIAQQLSAVESLRHRRERQSL